MKLQLTILLALMLATSIGDARVKKIRVQEALRVELNSVLKASNDLHSACFKRDEAKIAAGLKQLLKRIDRATKKSVLAGGSRQHLVRILNAAKQEIEMSQVLTGKERKTSLKNAFGQVVQLAQVFHLKRYRIFFCSKDRSTWLQKGWRAQNPIHPNIYPKCGKLVR